MNRALPVSPLMFVSKPGGRSAELTETVTGQFNVEADPRYAPGDGMTWCNIWAWDWSRAMGAEVPHWVDANGRPAKPFEPSARELTANALTAWFEGPGFDAGWREVRSVGSVLAEVNAGNVAVATIFNPGGHGHITPIVPTRASDPANTIMVSHVGGHNRQRCTLAQAFGSWAGRGEVRFWVHP